MSITKIIRDTDLAQGTLNQSFAFWVRSTLRLMRSSPHKKYPLYDSSIQEPTGLLSQVVADSFCAEQESPAPPESFVSVFLRNHPTLEGQLSDRYNIGREHILCTTGATMAVGYVYEALCQPGDHILVERPGFDIFSHTATRKAITVNYFMRKAPSFEIDIDDVLARLTDKTRLVVLTDPHNPSGAPTPRPLLSQLCVALAARNIALVVDEVYRDYTEVFDDGLDPAQYPNIIRLGSMTKNFGLNALRCGWIFAGAAVYKALRDEVFTEDYAVSKLSHSMATEVFHRVEEFDDFRRSIMNTARPIMADWLLKMEQAGHILPGTNALGPVCFPRLMGIDDTAQFVSWLNETRHVLPVPGECFDQAGHIRIGFALEENLLCESLDRLAEGICEYRATYANSQRAI